ncbi:gp436 family protein [Oleidesulfovibrio alaskensis]|jgi:phage gp36-like protein|uniref:gp436 family protein n=1 Tax=Oleidesulfovibrio alaskensis TaxID=58180 RepID=UPI000412D697|nr:DUF1320 domain-containing protein [Oleidesulfovibrio alaskensis]
MSYATIDHLIAAFGLDEVIAVTDRAQSGEPDTAVALGALEEASSEADSYLSVRYALPLQAVPPVLRTAVCDIALYRLTGGPATQTEVIATRYKAAVAWLRDVASGRASLPEVTPPEQEQADGVDIYTGTRGWLA